MKNISELKDYDVSCIAQSLKNSRHTPRSIASILLDENWKYCGSDEELREAYKEIYNKEFNSDDDFYKYIEYSRGIIFLRPDKRQEYLIKAKRKLKNNNVCALSTGLKWRIVCQLMAQEFDILEIADIVFAQHEKQEWIYCEDALDLKELIEDDTGKYASCMPIIPLHNPIMTLHETFSDSYLVFCRLN